MDRQQNSQMKKDKRTNNETHNITQKTNDWRYQKGKKPYINGQTTKQPNEKGQTMKLITLHRKRKIKQHEPH
jgi:hypothetical protein